MKESNHEIITDSDDTVIVETNCACACPDHKISLLIESMGNDPLLTLFFNVGCADIEHNSWFSKIWWRIKTATKILCTGNTSYCGEFIFRGKKHYEDFIEVLIEGKNQIEKNQISRSV